MTVRIFLHGGNSNRDTEKNEIFYRELLSNVPRTSVRILCVYFARPEQRWEDSYDDDQVTFRRVGRDLGLEVEAKLAASSDVDDFLSDISETDIVFINGGMRGNLKEVLLAIGSERLWNALDGKTLVGVSAGANILSKYYYSMVVQGVRVGTGFLNIKLLTHYTETMPEQLKLLEDIEEDLPIITVREEEYVNVVI